MASPVHVRRVGDPVLRQVATAVRLPLAWGSDDAVAIDNLHATLQAFRAEHGFGRAIAMPQIGVSKRVVACHLSEPSASALAAGVKPDVPFTMLNPAITYKSEDDTFTMWDDCMSFPSLLVRVQRFNSISVSYFDEDGVPHHMDRLPRNESELLQHEFDHLDGILSFDRIAPSDSVASVVYREEFDANRDLHVAAVDYTI